MNRRAFTLIEVLVSLAVMMLLVGSAMASFLQLRTMTRRIQARQALHDTSRIVFDRLRTECDAMVHAGAWWLRSAPGGDVELIYLRGKTDTMDYSMVSTDQAALTDLVWSRLAWSGSTNQLTLSASSTIRKYQLSQAWNSPSGRNYQNACVAFLPQAVRQAGADPQIVLDANSIGNGDPNDIGDYTDLLRNAVPLATGCISLSIQAVLADGSTVDADASTTTSLCGDGLPITGRDVLIGNVSTRAWDRRPRLFRLMFTLKAPGARIDPNTGADDPATVIQQTFSYTLRTSLLTPGP